MKTLYIICLLLFILSTYSFSKIDVEKVKSNLEVMQNAGNAGREFWLSVTPVHWQSYSPDSISLYVLSTVKSKLDVSIGSKFYSRSFEVEPNIIKLIRIDTSYTNPIKSDSTKLKDADIYPKSGIHIKSDYPIIVYVYTKRAFHSDGYFAIPTVASTNRYINMNYYSSDYGNLLFPCYTSVISHSDNTKVKITMGGGQAALNSMKTGRNAMSFNAAGVSYATMIANGAFMGSNNIDAYIMRFDPLNIAQSASSYDILPSADGNVKIIDSWTLESIYNGHAISNFRVLGGESID